MIDKKTHNLSSVTESGLTEAYQRADELFVLIEEANDTDAAFSVMLSAAVNRMVDVYGAENVQEMLRSMAELIPEGAELMRLARLKGGH